MGKSDSDEMKKLETSIQRLETDKQGLVQEKANLEAKLCESARHLDAEKARYQNSVAQLRAEEKAQYEEVCSVLHLIPVLTGFSLIFCF